jgi:hypothetical protein
VVQGPLVERSSSALVFDVSVVVFGCTPPSSVSLPFRDGARLGLDLLMFLATGRLEKQILASYLLL